MARDKGRLDLKADIECAIGLHVDCGGAEGVYKVRDAVLLAVLPHFELAYKRGLMATQSRAGYRLVRENERLRRELRQATALTEANEPEEETWSAPSATATPASAPERKP